MNICLEVSCLRMYELRHGISIEQVVDEVGRCLVEVVADSGTVKLSAHVNDLALLEQADALLVRQNEIPFKKGDVLTLNRSARVSNGKYVDFRFTSNKDRLSRAALDLLEARSAS
jgi:hypothetical protein